MSQKLRIIKLKKPNKAKGIFIHKRSIGTMYVNGIAYTFNADKVLTNKIEFDDAIEGIDTKKAKKKIYIRRK